MHAFVLEDWLTIRGGTSAVITQEETHWLDLEAFQDVIIYLECREASPIGGTLATIAFQTAPAKQETMFQPLVSQSISFGTPAGGATALQVIPALLLSAANPLARYLRWQITGPAAAWDATFRVLVAANSPGM